MALRDALLSQLMDRAENLHERSLQLWNFTYRQRLPLLGLRLREVAG